MAFDIPRMRIVPVDHVDVRLDPSPHPFEVAHAEAIEENWQAEIAAHPAYFDGRIVLLSRLVYRDGRLEGLCHPIRFATLMYWRRDRARQMVEHSFAYAALVSSDNALVAIRMAAHTANPGQVYFAAGSFEPADFPDGQVDLDFNMRREVGEETGLDLAAAEPEAACHLYSVDNATVIFRRYRMDATADEIAARISAFVAKEAEPEIDGPVILRGVDDISSTMRPHMAAIVRWHFAGA